MSRTARIPRIIAMANMKGGVGKDHQHHLHRPRPQPSRSQGRGQGH
ncbi:ParA family protein [Bifidobacterium dentium]